MKRKFIPLDKLQIFDSMHTETENGFNVDEAKDGQSTENHIQGIEYIKSIIKNGQKVLPPLVLENNLGELIRLDGFKRCMAFRELGYKSIEAFVCTYDEYIHSDYIPFRNGKMRAWKGGQFDDTNQKRFSLFEGKETEDSSYENVYSLFKSPDGSGLQIELCEAFHIHWGEVGKNRLILGRNDFITLASTIAKI